MAEINEKCAVVGVVNGDESASYTADYANRMLFALQHRGTEASGIATQEIDGSQHEHSDTGYVKDVFDKEILETLTGKVAIGHNRYSTSGDKSLHKQPVIDPVLGFAFAHNGNLPVTDNLARKLELRNVRVSELNDSEMMGHSIAHHIREGQDLPDAVELAYDLFRGAFSCVAIHDGTLVAFRDAKGIRPLSIGTTEDGLVVASETCALDMIGAEYTRDVEPGELVIMSPGSQKIESRQLANPDPKLDMFELVYFARHDSYLYGLSVNEVRRKFGEKLAEEFPPDLENADNILVVPVPDTSVPAAEGYAEALDLKHNQAILKNRYAGRSFIEPDQQKRRSLLKLKHTVMAKRVEGKDLIFIDDSLVRMNTLPAIVEQALEYNARSVTCLLASPPVRFPDFYGIDTPSQDELAAANLKISEMRKTIGCTKLGFLSLSGMVEATGLPADHFNLASFNGEYPVGIGKLKNQVRRPVSMKFAS